MDRSRTLAVGVVVVPAVAGAAVVADTDSAVVPDAAGGVDKSAAYTSVDPAVLWDRVMDQLTEPEGVDIVADDRASSHSGLAKRIGSRIRMADTAVVACIVDAGIDVVAVLAYDELSTPVVRQECDHIDRLLGITCLASRLAFLNISEYHVPQNQTHAAWYASLLHSAVASLPQHRPVHTAHEHEESAANLVLHKPPSDPGYLRMSRPSLSPSALDRKSVMACIRAHRIQ